jgi:hypothetical protein
MRQIAPICKKSIKSSGWVTISLNPSAHHVSSCQLPESLVFPVDIFLVSRVEDNEDDFTGAPQVTLSVLCSAAGLSTEWVIGM